MSMEFKIIRKMFDVKHINSPLITHVVSSSYDEGELITY